MKITLLLSLVILTVFSACKKQNEAAPAVTANNDPSIVSNSFFPVYAGTNQSVAFDVVITSDSNAVQRLELFGSPAALKWSVEKPATGKYRMYDHVGDYPTYASKAFYYFVFTKKNGTKITTTPFQVY